MDSKTQFAASYSICKRYLNHQVSERAIFLAEAATGGVLKLFLTILPTICLSAFDHFMNLALKGLKISQCA